MNLQILILVTLLGVGSVLPKRFKCPSNECQCVYGGPIELYCPNDHDPKVSFSVIENSFKITCESSPPNETDYSFLPKLNVDDITSVMLSRCIVPSEKQSFLQALENINVSNLRSFYFNRGIAARYSGNWAITKNHLKGLETLERFVFSAREVTAIPPNLFESMGNLGWLSWRTDMITLPEGIFDPLVNLTILELNHNKLNTLPSQFLKNQKNLSRLFLAGNLLNSLTRDMFIGANNVDELDLSANALTTLSSDAFAEMSKITVINLSSNNFKTLPEGLFSHNKNLKSFKMVHNRIPLRTLPSDFLAHLTSLEDIEIKADLETLPETVFDGSNKIVNLTLSNNQLEVLPPFLFKDQTDLSLLDLSHNKITELDKDLLSYNTKLTKLDLSYNKIETIPESFFEENRHLIDINFEHNQLKTIHDSAMSSLINLKKLDMSHNQLNFAGVSDGESALTPFDSLIKLKHLNLRSNSIENMFQLFNTQIETLDLSYNKITDIGNGDFAIGNSEVFVDLSHNQIESIDIREDEPTFNSFKTIVELSDNPIECGCRLLNFLKFQKRQLNLQDTTYNNFILKADNLKCFSPPNMANKNVSSLELLELMCPYDNPNTNKKYCPQDCSCMYRKADRTLIANCSSAHLRSTPSFSIFDTKEDVASIILNIQNNNITELRDLSSKTVELYAANNQIHRFNSNNLSLKVLDIRNNLVERINHTALVGISNISLSGNPLICDCDSRNLLNFVKKYLRKFNDYTQITCRNNGPKFSLSTIEDFCYKNKLVIISIGSAIAFFGLIIGLLAALYYKYNHEIKVWLYAHNWCLWFVTEDELDRGYQYDAFVSFSQLDEDFVAEQLVPELEGKKHPYKLCLHMRDWIPGEFIPRQIENSVNNSRRTVVVLSPNFLKSVWGQMEFRAAHKRAIEERRARVVVIIYGDIGDIETLDEELKLYLKTNTYVKWGDPWFWNKLRYALPHRIHDVYEASNGVGDKVELIMESPNTPPQSTPPANTPIRNVFENFNGNNDIHMNGNLHKGTNGINGINGHINPAFINTNARQSDV